MLIFKKSVIKPRRGALSRSGRTLRSEFFELSDFLPSRRKILNSPQELFKGIDSKNKTLTKSELKHVEDLHLDLIREEVDTLLRSTNYHHIGKMKESLATLLEVQERAILQHDKKLITSLPDIEQSSIVDRSTNTEYLNLCENVASVTTFEAFPLLTQDFFKKFFF